MEVTIRARKCLYINGTAQRRPQMKLKFDRSMDRRNKLRFPFNRELRYKLLENDTIIAAGEGETIDMSSGGVAFRTSKALTAGSLIELSISWPALLYDSCPMR